MFVDLDRLKLVNDNHGQATGDSVLTVVAERLMRHVRDEDNVCRNAGDEFRASASSEATRPKAD